jgi:hypothetical protein
MEQYQWYETMVSGFWVKPEGFITCLLLLCFDFFKVWFYVLILKWGLFLHEIFQVSSDCSLFTFHAPVLFTPPGIS